MPQIALNSFKIAPRLPLDKVADFFKLKKPLPWNQYIVLQDAQLDIIFKYGTHNKSAYIFEFGCVTLVNFSEGEIRDFVAYIDAIAENIDYDMYIKYYETHVIDVFDDGTCRLWERHEQRLIYNESVSTIAAIILAKSAALYKIEVDTSTLIDEAEKFIHYLQKGKLRTGSKNFTTVAAKLLRYEFDSINAIRVFERLGIDTDHLIERENYDHLASHYELHERFDVLENKIKDLQHIMSAYATLSYKNAENKRNLLLIFLLALFPLSYGFEHLLDKFKGVHVFDILFK